MNEPQLRHPYDREYTTGNDQYKGIGTVKWCIICDEHRPIAGGFTAMKMGGKHFHCSKHPELKPSLPKRIRSKKHE